MNLTKVAGGAVVAFSLGLGLFGTQACSTSNSGSGFGDAGTAIADPNAVDLSDGGKNVTVSCDNLECKRTTCAVAGEDTTITGKVFDPSGKNPLYNAIVYVPNRAPAPLATGAKCESCSALALSPVTVALTDEEGKFTLRNVPVSDDLPIVIQVGKWRRQLTLPKVERCRENKVVDGTFRLPRNQAEGDLPQFALVTGGCDPLGCLLSRAGIDAAEFTAPTGKGRVHVYKGVGGEDIKGGGAPAADQALWNSTAQLAKYDVAVLSCECSENNNTKPPASKAAMRDYLNGGGRVFATHYHYTWFQNGPPDLASTADWAGDKTDTGGPYTIDTSFPKGLAFSKWLKNVGASPDGQTIALNSPSGNINAARGNSQQWITSKGGPKVKYMSLNTPVNLAPKDQCGRAVISTLHVSSETGGTANKATMPEKCSNTPLTAQEKALLFLMFDLSSCVTDDKEPPVVPN